MSAAVAMSPQVKADLEIHLVVNVYEFHPRTERGKAFIMDELNLRSASPKAMLVTNKQHACESIKRALDLGLVVIGIGKDVDVQEMSI